MNATDWMTNANCRGVDPDLFFPVTKSLEREAQAVCSGCEVRAECAEFAKTSNEGRREVFGIWAGVNHEKKTEFVQRRLTPSTSVELLRMHQQRRASVA